MKPLRIVLALAFIGCSALPLLAPATARAALGLPSFSSSKKTSAPGMNDRSKFNWGKMPGTDVMKPSTSSKPGMVSKVQGGAKKLATGTKHFVTAPFHKKTPKAPANATGYTNVKAKTDSKSLRFGSSHSDEKPHPSKSIGDFLSAPKP